MASRLQPGLFDEIAVDAAIDNSLDKAIKQYEQEDRLTTFDDAAEKLIEVVEAATRSKEKTDISTIINDNTQPQNEVTKITWDLYRKLTRDLARDMIIGSYQLDLPTSLWQELDPSERFAFFLGIGHRDGVPGTPLLKKEPEKYGFTRDMTAEQLAVQLYTFAFKNIYGKGTNKKTVVHQIYDSGKGDWTLNLDFFKNDLDTLISEKTKPLVEKVSRLTQKEKDNFVASFWQDYLRPEHVGIDLGGVLETSILLVLDERLKDLDEDETYTPQKDTLIISALTNSNIDPKKERTYTTTERETYAGKKTRTPTKRGDGIIIPIATERIRSGFEAVQSRLSGYFGIETDERKLTYIRDSNLVDDNTWKSVVVNEHGELFAETKIIYLGHDHKHDSKRQIFNVYINAYDGTKQSPNKSLKEIKDFAEKQVA
jgi:hypothetical protein